ncbi:hypothetical protein TNCV_1781741 [Trichonephila clavipes]|nr:hypothetical protein TNCV_1781741 [Trichonephila clavipes]
MHIKYVEAQASSRWSGGGGSKKWEVPGHVSSSTMVQNDEPEDRAPNPWYGSAIHYHSATGPCENFKAPPYLTWLRIHGLELIDRALYYRRSGRSEADALIIHLIPHVSMMWKIDRSVGDDNVCAAPIMDDKDILKFVQNSKNIDADSDDENEMKNVAPAPTSSEMRNILKKQYQKIVDSHCVPREVNFCSRKHRDNVANIFLSWQLTPAKNLTSPERLQIPELSIIPPSTSPLNKVDHVNKSNPNKRNTLHILRIIRETWEHGTAREERDLSQKGR